MARSKQRAAIVPRLPRPPVARMTSSWRRFSPSPSPPPSPKEKGPVTVFLSGEIRDLERDMALHPTLSIKPRQSPAMSRYRGSETRAPKKRVRRRKRKPKLTAPQEPQVVTPVTEPEIISPPTAPNASTLQPEVIDLTAEG
ncbi:hypothetical protein EDB86DRAFT_3095149 [Lactarius hatsudake]|nr:hypothetical protein EDB86DRAFT_3095149 [Lactarius hatsudake]